MREFFKGWRRKAGCATLVMSCVLATGWVRSLQLYDEWSLKTGRTTVELISSRGVIAAIHCVDRPNEEFDFWKEKPISFSTNPQTDIFYDPLGGGDFRPVRRCFQLHWVYGQAVSYGFNFSGPPKEPDVVADVIGIQTPYWSLVIPLTLLSAWLLITKPRPIAPKKTEPAPATGT